MRIRPPFLAGYIEHRGSALATIQDVARRARVSPATVSRVLNSSSTVHPDLVRRVRAAVEALSYQPNGVAAGCAAGSRRCGR
jgi:DNA-binding LacI/PurR family transcriptional regulator